jgi:hypothetical protein
MNPYTMNNDSQASTNTIKVYVTMRKEYESDIDYKRLTLMIDSNNFNIMITVYRQLKDSRLETQNRERVL